MATKPAKPTEFIMDDGVPTQMAPENTSYKVPVFNRIPNVFTPEIAEQLKAALQVSGLPIKLYKITFDNETFIVRPLMIRDWLEVQKFIQAQAGNIRPDQVERRVVETALVWPKEVLQPLCWELQRAGLQKALYDNIMARSGFIVSDVDQSEFLRVEPLSTTEIGPRPEADVIEHLQKNTDWTLRLVFVDGEYYVIRPLTRAEWTTLSKLGEGVDVDVATCEKICLWSKEYPLRPSFENAVAGTSTTLSALAMQFSGFNSQPQVEEL